MAKSKSYIGGGNLYIRELKDASDKEWTSWEEEKDWSEWGLVDSMNLSLKQESKEIFAWSQSGYKESVEEVVISKDYSISFESADLSDEALMIAFNATKEKEKDASKKDTGRSILKLGDEEAKYYQLKFVGTGRNKLEVRVYKIMLKSDVDLALIGDDFKKIKFEGKALSDGKDVMTIISGSKTTDVGQ